MMFLQKRAKPQRALVPVHHKKLFPWGERVLIFNGCYAFA